MQGLVIFALVVFFLFAALIDITNWMSAYLAETMGLVVFAVIAIGVVILIAYLNREPSWQEKMNAESEEEERRKQKAVVAADRQYPYPPLETYLRQLTEMVQLLIPHPLPQEFYVPVFKALANRYNEALAYPQHRETFYKTYEQWLKASAGVFGEPDQFCIAVHRRGAV